MRIYRSQPPSQNEPWAQAVGEGVYSQYQTIHQFGYASDCDSGVLTDIWDGADGTTSTDIWVPPTQARTHTIASTSSNDTFFGTGMRSISVTGLTSWDADDFTTESLTLNGTAGMTTSNQYVIIWRMRGVTWGTGGVNAGIITATAQTDSTVTAAIRAGINQTDMAILGISSSMKFSMYYARAAVVQSGGAALRGEGEVRVMENADTNAASNIGFRDLEDFSISTNVNWDRPYPVPQTFNGPAILKISVSMDTNNSKVAAAFDGVVKKSSA